LIALLIRFIDPLFSPQSVQTGDLYLFECESSGLRPSADGFRDQKNAGSKIVIYPRRVYELYRPVQEMGGRLMARDPKPFAGHFRYKGISGVSTSIDEQCPSSSLSGVTRALILPLPCRQARGSGTKALTSQSLSSIFSPSFLPGLHVHSPSPLTKHRTLKQETTGI
jgi:hypothetical protein